MKGQLYGVGVGPGDPELLTLKAVKTIQNAAVIAVPDSGTGEQVALDIACEHIGDKPVLRLPLPMTRDANVLASCRESAVDAIAQYLDDGQDVAFLTLGDSTIYATYSYIHRLVQARGYRAQMIVGVPSFCAAAAALNIPLCEGGQPLHILPASYEHGDEPFDGVTVFMKSGKKLGALLNRLDEKGLLPNASLAERVGMPNQRLVHTLTSDYESGYFSVVIVKPEET